MADGAELMAQDFPNLAKAFEILSLASQERWLSLTYKMGCNRAEKLVHAMCLILLKRHGEAHAKLAANSDSTVGNYLTEMVNMHGEHLNASHIGGFKSTDTSSLLDIARIFAILVQERLCDKSLRDQAYCVALASCKTSGLRSLDVEEEVKQVCGPNVISESNTDLATETYNLTSLDVSEPNGSHPSTSVCSSYSLQISSPTAEEAQMEESKPLSLRTPTDSESQDKLQHCLESASTRVNDHPQTAVVNDATNPNQCPDHNGTKSGSKSTNLSFSSTPNDGDKLRVQPINTNERKPPTQANSFRSTDASACDIDETFYAFVILHEAEDADEAQRLRDRLERIISGVGATFSDDFAQPGMSTLQCLEDAIENSAFTLLLLTQNFKSSLSATSADSAIVNSLENHHKLNSVIPLLPRENRLSRKSLPLVLQTKVPLDENNRAFERNALKAIAPDIVANQKKIWMKKQRCKKLVEEQKRLQEETVIDANLQREAAKLERLRLENKMQQNNMFYAASAPPPPSHGPMSPQHDAWQQKPSYIHIENAQNIMIGNHSTMNIDHAKSSAEDFDF